MSDEEVSDAEVVRHSPLRNITKKFKGLFVEPREEYVERKKFEEQLRAEKKKAERDAVLEGQKAYSESSTSAARIVARKKGLEEGVKKAGGKLEDFESGPSHEEQLQRMKLQEMQMRMQERAMRMQMRAQGGGSGGRPRRMIQRPDAEIRQQPQQQLGFGFGGGYSDPMAGLGKVFNQQGGGRVWGLPNTGQPGYAGLSDPTAGLSKFFGNQEQTQQQKTKKRRK